LASLNRPAATITAGSAKMLCGSGVQGDTTEKCDGGFLPQCVFAQHPLLALT
jgi:hypothetical protein